MGFDPNEMMLDLFRSEVESHSEALTSSLLKLERESPDKTFFDSMMRAAHSIKGAARIVGVDQAVDLSHVLEDCFVAAQRGELSFSPNDVDVMLRGVDLIVRISEATKDSPAAVSALEEQVRDVVVRLKAVRTGQAIPAASIGPSPMEEAIAPPISPAEGSLEPSVAVRVERVEATTTSEQPAKSLPEPAAKLPTIPVITEIVLKFPQHLDRGHAESMRARLLEQWHAQVERVTFDLSQTREIDAIGVGFLASAQQFIQRDHRARLHFQPVSSEMGMVLRIAGLQPDVDVQR